jgi:hypothetical protein
MTGGLPVRVRCGSEPAVPRVASDNIPQQLCRYGRILIARGATPPTRQLYYLQLLASASLFLLLIGVGRPLVSPPDANPLRT